VLHAQDERARTGPFVAPAGIGAACAAPVTHAGLHGPSSRKLGAPGSQALLGVFPTVLFAQTGGPARGFQATIGRATFATPVSDAERRAVLRGFAARLGCSVTAISIVRASAAALTATVITPGARGIHRNDERAPAPAPVLTTLARGPLGWPLAAFLAAAFAAPVRATLGEGPCTRGPPATGLVAAPPPTVDATFARGPGRGARATFFGAASAAAVRFAKLGGTLVVEQ
jgi:hypothetical protein